MSRNYQNGKIYTIRSRSRPDLIYVGSTIQPLSVRMGKHKKPANTCTSKQIIELSDAYIELLETYPCQNIEELRLRENHHMRSMDCVNKMLAINDCPHGKERCLCKICKGSCICDHGQYRNKCKICKGTSICQHNHTRSDCKLCHGKSICIHNRERKACKECKGSQICEHNKRRYTCKACHGVAICEHNKLRNSCKACCGSRICEHNKERRGCKTCSPMECDFCNFITSKGDFKSHLKSQNHKDNYKAEFLRVFESEITDADVPLF